MNHNGERIGNILQTFDFEMNLAFLFRTGGVVLNVMIIIMIIMINISRVYTILGDFCEKKKNGRFLWKIMKM